MGTLTVNPGYIPENAGSEKKIEGTFAFGNSYATGGESFTPAKFELSHVNRLVMAPNAGYLFQTDYTNNKVLVYTGDGGGGGNTDPADPGPQDMVNFAKSSVLKFIRVYLAAVVGVPAAGNVVTGGTSGATANVDAYVGDQGYVVVSGIAGGPFTDGEALSFSISGATATLRGNLVDAWTIVAPLQSTDIVQAVSNQVGLGLTHATFNGTNVGTNALKTGNFRVNVTSTPTSLETLNSDAYTGVTVAGTLGQTVADDTHVHAVGAGGGIGQVTNGTNLSALTSVPFEAYGF